MNIPYKSFCWSFGTTSFRTKSFNKTIEEQLSLLNEFWRCEENSEKKWRGNNKLQASYYDFMVNKGFVEGNAANKPKDAREKTSGLVDIGLIDEDRKLTNAGIELLQISMLQDFDSDNQFQIAKDSFIYLKQLLKTYYTIEGNTIRPFIALIYLLTKMDYLSVEEYTYLLPLCTGPKEIDNIINAIFNLRKGKITIDDIIINRLMDMNNYQMALKYLKDNVVSEDVIRIIGMNRKSSKENGKNYDKAYFPLYQALYRLYILKDSLAISLVYEATTKIKIGKWWRNLLFDTVSAKAIYKNPKQHLKNTIFDDIKDEVSFKEVFFKTMHLFKAKSTLYDYFDLNKRYIKTTEIVLFEDDTVKLDIIPQYFFKSVIKELYLELFKPSELLYENCSMSDISKCLVLDNALIISGIKEELEIDVSTVEQAKEVLENNRYKRLQHLIDTKFTDDKLIYLLDCFENRTDKEIKNMVTDNADVPTIFEYILGILWYKISERNGKILDYMKLSLDADLLPKTHAAGGEADIVYEYDNTESYPKHSLLIEATLADSTNQRRMEMEPVSRHLGQHLIKTGNLDSYAIFVTNNLNINVIADFRGRKLIPFYDSQDYSKSINGMKIIPIQISELKKVIENKKTYKELYELFVQAYVSNLPPHEWYNKCITIYLN